MLGRAVARQPAPMLAMRPIGLRLRHGADALGNAIGESLAAESQPVIRTLTSSVGDIPNIERERIEKFGDLVPLSIDGNLPPAPGAVADISGVSPAEYAPLAPDGAHAPISGRARLVLGSAGQSVSANLSDGVDLSSGTFIGLRVDKSRLPLFWRDDGYYRPRYAPSLGWNELGDYLNLIPRLKGFWDGFSISGALEGVANFLAHPIDSLEQGGQAMQDSRRQYFLAGRRGDFASAASFESRLVGEQASGMVVGTGLGAGLGLSMRAFRGFGNFTSKMIGTSLAPYSSTSWALGDSVYSLTSALSELGVTRETMMLRSIARSNSQDSHWANLRQAYQLARTKVDFAHIEADIDFSRSANKQVMGGHFSTSPRLQRIPGTEVVDANGVIYGQVRLQAPDGIYYLKTNNQHYSTMTPDSWSLARAKGEMSLAWQNRIGAGGLKYEGISSNVKFTFWHPSGSVQLWRGYPIRTTP